MVPPAVILEGQRELITAYQEETTQEDCEARLRGGPMRHRATVRYLLRDAVLVAGDLYCRGMRSPLRPGTSARSAILPLREELAAGALVQTWAGSRYFGHWLLDDRCTQILAHEYAPPLTTAVASSAQQREYLALFQQERLRVANAVFVRELQVFDDVGQNAHRTARLEHLRAMFQASARRSGHVVFICRGAAGSPRHLLNEERMASRLEQSGAVVVRQVERMSLAELAATIGGARLVVGMDSSGLAHGVLGVQRGGGFVVISPADRHNDTFKDWCDALGVRYGVVIARRHDDGYLLAEDDLLRTIDGVLAARAAA